MSSSALFRRLFRTSRTPQRSFLVQAPVANPYGILMKLRPSATMQFVEEVFMVISSTRCAVAEAESKRDRWANRFRLLTDGVFPQPDTHRLASSEPVRRRITRSKSKSGNETGAFDRLAVVRLGS